MRVCICTYINIFIYINVCKKWLLCFILILPIVISSCSSIVVVFFLSLIYLPILDPALLLLSLDKCLTCLTVNPSMSHSAFRLWVPFIDRDRVRVNIFPLSFCRFLLAIAELVTSQNDSVFKICVCAVLLQKPAGLWYVLLHIEDSLPCVILSTVLCEGTNCAKHQSSGV